MKLKGLINSESNFKIRDQFSTIVSNYEIHFYIDIKFQVMMNLLAHPDSNAIKYEAFHVFKCFAKG